MSGEEDTLESILASDASALVDKPAHLQLLSEWNKRISEINNSLPENQLGSKIFDAMKEHSKHISPKEATKLLELAQVRLSYHTSQGKYKKECRGYDDQLDHLPGLVHEIKSQDQATADTNIRMYLDYCRMHCPDQPIPDFITAYKRFVQVRAFYESVPDECKDLLALRDELVKGSWNELRKLIGTPKQERDKQYFDWMQKFEDAEKQHGPDFKDIITFINDYQRTTLFGREK